MAKSKNNVVTYGLSGKIADLLVFSQKNGLTIVGRTPRRSANLSAAQQAIHLAFQQAVLYAKGVMSNATLKAAYSEKAEGRQTAYNLAVADFFKSPEIGEMDTSSYTGQPGSTIKIPVRDNFKVVAVKVKIDNPDGSPAEQGDAILQNDGFNWLYTGTQSIASLPGSSITVTAFDTPGHSSTKQKKM